MAHKAQIEVRRLMSAADASYYRLLLLVGQAGSGKSNVLKAIAEQLDSSVINVSLVLSEELLNLTATQRVLQLPKLLHYIADQAETPVVLDNLEILFDVALQQDPLRLLQAISRNRTVLAAWNGRIESGKLLYAETSHPEYRAYNAADVLAVMMNDTITTD